MYALYLADDGRILHVTGEEFVTNIATEEGKVTELLEGYVLVESLPEGDVTDYRYVNGEFAFDPVPVETPAPERIDVIEAQITYTAMMTDTLLEV